MAVSQEVLDRIEQDVAALGRGEYRRPGASMVKFLGEQSVILGQAEQDKDALVKAGFDYAKMEYYRGLFEVLSLAHGQRLGASNMSPDQRAQFETDLALAEIDKKRMVEVAGHVVERSGDARVLRNYRDIMKGRGTVDTLCDVLGLASLIRRFPQFASEIKPGGYAIDETYIATAEKRAVDLLQLRGFVVENGQPQDAAVDRQNRLITLCLKAQADIKKYAHAAFLDNPEYYNSNYVNSPSPKPDTPVVEPQKAAEPAKQDPAKAA